MNYIPFALGAATVIIIAWVIVYVPFEAFIGAFLFLITWIFVGLIACLVGAMFQSIYDSLKRKIA